MGMYDSITVSKQLLIRVGLPVQTDITFQTKDLDCLLDEYVVREDGTLHIETYTTEDRSDPNATGIARYFGCMTRVPTGWKHMTDFTDTITDMTYKHDGSDTLTHISMSFKDGVLCELVVVPELA